LANKKTVEVENDELRDHNKVLKNNINELRNENNELKRKWEGLDGGDGE
jgi:FtsZ-binding cell division protein ZapB